MQGLHDCLIQPEALATLLGKPCTGKTALCGKLTRFMRLQGYRVIHFDQLVDSPDMLRILLAKELDLPQTANFSRVLEDSLSEWGPKPLILIFDDAHLLSDITLIEIYRLAEVQIDGRRMLNLLLSGDPVLSERLSSNEEFKSLAQLLTQSFSLQAMNKSTLPRFVYDYLAAAGYPGLEWQSAALSDLQKISKGYPGPATRLCQSLIATRRASGDLSPVSKSEIGALLANAPSNEHFATSELRDMDSGRIMAPLFAVLAIASMGYIYGQLNGGAATANSAAPASLAAQATQSESPFVESDQAPGAAESDAVTAGLSEAAESDPSTEAAELVAAQESRGDEAEQLIPTANNADTVGELTQADPSPRPIVVEVATDELATATEEPATAELPEANAVDESAIALRQDSSLRLVSATERGVEATEIEEPVFEFLALSELTEEAPDAPDSLLNEAPTRVVDVPRVDEFEPPQRPRIAAANPGVGLNPVLTPSVFSADDTVIPVPPPTLPEPDDRTLVEEPAVVANTAPVTAAIPSPEAQILPTPVDDDRPEQQLASQAADPGVGQGVEPLSDAAVIVAADAGGRDDRPAEVVAASNAVIANDSPDSPSPEDDSAPLDAGGLTADRGQESGQQASRNDVQAPIVAARVVTEAALEPQIESVVVAPELAIENAVRQWTEAWADQDLDAYFGHYHADFVPRYHGNLTQWRSNRQRVIGNADWIELEIREFEVVDINDSVTEVHFWLDYQSPTYRDSTLKRINLSKDVDRWLITAEVNMEVRN